jgi:hypothetical protein
MKILNRKRKVLVKIVVTRFVLLKQDSRTNGYSMEWCYISRSSEMRLFPTGDVSSPLEIRIPHTHIHGMYAFRRNDVKIYGAFPRRFGEEPYIRKLSQKPFCIQMQYYKPITYVD